MGEFDFGKAQVIGGTGEIQIIADDPVSRAVELDGRIKGMKATQERALSEGVDPVLLLEHAYLIDDYQAELERLTSNLSNEQRGYLRGLLEMSKEI